MTAAELEPLPEGTLETLRKISTSTIATQLYKRGFRQPQLLAQQPAPAHELRLRQRHLRLRDLEREAAATRSLYEVFLARFKQTRLKGFEPKNPRRALRGEGWTDSTHGTGPSRGSRALVTAPHRPIGAIGRDRRVPRCRSP